MSKQIVGIDISDNSIEAVVLKQPVFGRPKVIAYARTTVRGALIANGIIKKPKELAEKIKELLASAQPKPIKAIHCVVSIPDSQVFTAVFRFPAGLRRSEIYTTIPYKAEEIIPFKSSEIYFDFKPITKVNDSQEVFYAAAPIKVVDAYTDMLEQAGLVPVAYDLESVSLTRSLVQSAKDTAPQKRNEPGLGVLVLDIGARTTNLNIFDRNGIRENIEIKIAGNRFTKAVAGAKKLKDAEANKLKMKVGFTATTDPAVAEALAKEAKPLIAEIKKVVSYYEAEANHKIGSVILAGGSSLLPGIGTFLSKELGIPAVSGNALAKVDDPSKLIAFKSKALLFANAIGLGLRGLQKDPISADLNLLPVSQRRFTIAPQKKDTKAWRKVYVRLGVLLVLGAIFGGLLYVKQQGFDIYEQVYPTPEIEYELIDTTDQEILDELRNQFLIPTSTATTTDSTATSTATTTEPIVQTPAAPQVKIKILSTGIGYLNVRQGPGTNTSKVGQVVTGSEFVVQATEGDWYKILFNDPEIEGWVFKQYVEEIK